MPHNGKKRKRCHKVVDLKIKGTKKQRDEINQETDNSENIQEENTSPSKTDDLSERQLNSAINDLDVEQELEKSACKSNLSVFNVKSIIHHVLSDDRVVAMACSADNKQQNKEKDSASKDCLFNIIEPKLTRSKVREVAETTGTSLDPLLIVKEKIIQSPVKNIISPSKKRRFTPVKINTPDKLEDNGPFNDEVTSVKLPLAFLHFPECESSDEEYDPLKENNGQSDDDSEGGLSSASNLASPALQRSTSRGKRRLVNDDVTPSLCLVDQSVNDERDEKVEIVREEKSLSPLSAMPLTQTAEKINDDLIATRTRSRLPLTETSIESIEAQFVPPDLPSDLYDVFKLEDLEEDEIDWHKWLYGINAEKEAVIETDDPEDSEYNFMAEEQKEEKEEYRTDRAVKISQKELTDLLEQFLNEFSDETPVPQFNTSRSTNDNDCTIFLRHRQCLVEQLQKHTQLLVQISLLSKEHPDLSYVTSSCEELFQDMSRMNDMASSVYVSRLAYNKYALPPVFSSVQLDEAQRLMNLPWPSHVSTTKATKSIKSTSSLVIPDELKTIMTSSPFFAYPDILPHVTFNVKKSIPSRGEKFLQSEDNLLVLGLEKCGRSWSDIKKCFLPVKTLNQIKIRRKNMCSKRAYDNVVKEFENTGIVPLLPRIPAMPANAEEKTKNSTHYAVRNKDTTPSWYKKLNPVKVPTKSKKPSPISCKKKDNKKKKTIKPSDGDVNKIDLDSRNSSSVTPPSIILSSCPSTTSPSITSSITPPSVALTSLPSNASQSPNTTLPAVATPSRTTHEISEITAIELKDVSQRTKRDSALMESTCFPAKNKDNLKETLLSKVNDSTASMISKDKNVSTRQPVSAQSKMESKMRPILPNPISLLKEKEILPTSTVQSKSNDSIDPGRCRSNGSTTEAGNVDTMQTSNAKSVILQSSEKENIQPQLDGKSVENSRDCNVSDSTSSVVDDSEARAISFAQTYLNNVKKFVKEDGPLYLEFLNILTESKSNSWKPTRLYKKIADIFSEFPELVRDFVGFLEPHEALEANVFMQHKDIVKARNFFECLQNHFAKSPSHLQKILKCLASFDLNRSSINQFYDAILPLLKGQQFLIEQFNSLFDHLKPKQSNIDDFEEVELGSGSEIEADDFEDFIIPDMKRSVAKVSQACKPVAKGTGGPLSRRFSKPRKDETGERKDGNRERKEGDDERIDGYDERNDGYDERNDGYDERNDGYDERNDGYDERNDGYDERNDGYDERNDGYDERNDGYDERNGGYDERNDGYDGRNDGYDERNDGYDERNDGYDERNDGYDERNDGYDERNDGYDERNDGEDETKDGDVERNDENVDVSEKYVDVAEESIELPVNNNDEIPDRMIDSDDDVELDDDMLDQENNENEGAYNQSNHSSPSSECRSVYEAFEDYMQSRETNHKNQLTSKSEVVNVSESLDIKNDAVETPSLIGASHVDIDHCENGVFSSFENWNVRKDGRSCSNEVDDEMSNSYEKKTRDILDIAENSHTKVEKEANKVRIDTNTSTNIQRKISAQNLQVDEDGKSIIWTREDDKIILQFCQLRGVHENTFEDIAKELGEKTAKQVKSRFRILMSLLSRDDNDSQSESEDDSCHDDEEM